MDRSTKSLTLKCEDARSRVWGQIKSVLKFIQVSVKLVMGWSHPLSPRIQWALLRVLYVYLSWSWAPCWPVPVSRVQKSLSKVYRDSFCQLGSSISLPWVVYFEAFYLHVVFSFSCIPVICPQISERWYSLHSELLVTSVRNVLILWTTVFHRTHIIFVWICPYIV